MQGLTYKRVSIFCGHYGSGKTNIAVNYALRMKADGIPTKIADLDIVNPYFRTKDSAEELEAAGIPLISPAFANSNVDLPALPQELYSLVQRTDHHAVLDVGGDDRGAYALGRYAPYILEENDYDMFCVVNFFRPLTKTAEEAYAVMQEVSQAAGMPFTAIINNSNLGPHTTLADVAATEREVCRLSEMAAIPVRMTTVHRPLISADTDTPYFPIDLQKKYFDIVE